MAGKKDLSSEIEGKATKAKKKLAWRIADWEKLPANGAINGGKTKMLPGGYAFHKPGSQNSR